MDADLGGCKICGQVEFSNGCHMRVDYVTGCETEDNGPVQLLSYFGDTTISPADGLSSSFVSSVTPIPWVSVSKANSSSGFRVERSSSGVTSTAKKTSGSVSITKTDTYGSVTTASRSSEKSKISSGDDLSETKTAETQKTSDHNLEASVSTEMTTKSISRQSSTLSRFGSSAKISSSTMARNSSSIHSHSTTEFE